MTEHRAAVDAAKAAEAEAGSSDDEPDEDAPYEVGVMFIGMLCRCEFAGKVSTQLSGSMTTVFYQCFTLHTTCV